MFDRKSPPSKFRYALPSCLVNLIIEKYPDPNNEYAGYKGKLPSKIYLHGFNDCMVDKMDDNEIINEMGII